MKIQHMNRIALGTAALLLAFVARADLDYADKPLFYASGVQPNVLMMIDNSGSMVNDGSHDTGSSYPYLDVCNNNASVAAPSTFTTITRYEAAMQAACQVVLDNASAMRIGFSTFDGEGESKHDTDPATPNTSNLGLSIKSEVGTDLDTLLDDIYATGIDGIDGATPLDSTMYGLSRAYRGKTYRDSGSTVSSTSPIQYRCQKNYLLYFTDGAPNDAGDWGDSTPVMQAGDPVNNSPWNAVSGSFPSWSGGLPNWDGYSDLWDGSDTNTTVGSGDGEIAWMDDIAQMLYDTDLQVDGSAAYGVVCPAGSENTYTTAAEDCSGESWDDPSFPTQNVVTYTVGFGSPANNEMMRDTPLVDQHLVAAADVDATANTIAWLSHGLDDGQYAHYYATYLDLPYSTTATANTAANTLSGNTLNMMTGDVLTYNNGGGANLQYQEITTPGANCGAIGGLTSGNTYYIDDDNANRFYLSTSRANAYGNTETNLNGTGTANTVHTFTRTQAAVMFSSTGGTTSLTPVNITTNVEKITKTAHGLNTGDLVTYTCTGTSCTIGGLTSGSTYYVANRGANEFRLANTALLATACAGLIDGNAGVATSCRDLTGRGSNGGVQMFVKTDTGPIVTFSATGAGTVPVDTNNDRITTSAAHGFSAGDAVTYTCSNFAAVYTAYNLPSTVYVTSVTAGNPGTFQVSVTSGGSPADLVSAGTAAQTFSWTRSTAQTAIGGLYPYVTDAPPDDTPNPGSEAAAQGKYYVKGVDEDTIQLYGAIRYGRSPFETIQATFAGTSASTTSTDRKITLEHNFVTGDAVVYTCPSGCTGGLTNGNTYYVGVVDNNEIRLATTSAAAAGCTTGTTGCVSFTATDVDWQFLTYTPPTPTPLDLSGSTGTGVLSTGPGKSYFAASAAELSNALKNAFTEIRAQELSFASLASNSSELTTESRLYQARFNTADWSGDVRALTIVNGTVNENNPDWRAYEKLPTALTRNILTRNGASTFAFTAANWSSFSTAQQTSLNNGTTQTVGEAVINWTRGDVVNTYRTRVNGNLGDILNSSLVYVGQPAEGYANIALGLPASDPAKTSYLSFKGTLRTPMVYGGSNGGMLHGFDASTNASKGVEQVAFIPEGVYTDWVDADNDGVKDASGEPAVNKFWDVARSYYGLVTSQPHHYFVDGTPTTGDVYFDDFARADLTANQWHTVLVGGLGKGGRSVYALDVTDGNFDTDDLLWEFNDSNSGDMGYSYSRPVIARLSDGEWVAIFGNGYDSRADQARLYIVDIEDGSLIQEITLGSAGNNGLSSVSLLRSNTNADGVTALTVYAGDLLGNVWKVDISDAASLPPSVATPFFTAQDSFGNRQAITSEITLQRYDDLNALDGAAPEGGVMLFFGTGSYFTTGDTSYDYPTVGPQYHAMYGIWDKGDVSTVALTELQEQTMGTVNINSVDYRTASADEVSYDGSPAPMERGWYMKLAVTDPTDVFRGELAVFSPTAVGTYLVFSTITPADADPCESGGSGSLYVVNALTGGSNAYSPFDLNDDGSNLDENAAVIGLDFSDVLLSKPLVLEDTGNSIDGDKSVCVGKSDGSVECKDLFDPPGPTATSNLNSGRMSWRQLQ